MKTPAVRVVLDRSSSHDGEKVNVERVLDVAVALTGDRARDREALAGALRGAVEHVAAGRADGYLAVRGVELAFRR